MTTIAIVPTGFNNNDTDFLRAPNNVADSAVRVYSGSVAVPAATAVDAYVGLVPFQRGAKIRMDGSSLHIGAVGGTTTADVGFVYFDATTDVPQALVAGAAVATAGFIAPTVGTAINSIVQPTEGWLALRIKTAITTNPVTITYNFLVSY